MHCLEMRWRNDWTGFFLVYFKWCYYLCITPFRFEWDASAKRFRLERNRLQSVVCALQYVLLGIWYLKDLRKIPVDNLYKNPAVYFSLAFNLNAIYYHVVVLASYVWRRQERFLAIVNFDCSPCATSCANKRKLLAVFLCLAFAILPLLYSLSGYQVIPTSCHWDPSSMLRCLVVEGRFAFFLNGTSSQPCNNGNPPELAEISIIDVILAMLAFLMETARQIFGFYSDFFPLICAISLWTSIESLQECLMDGRDSPPPPPHQNVEEQRIVKRNGFVGSSCCNKANNLSYIPPLVVSTTPVTTLEEKAGVVVHGLDSKKGDMENTNYAEVGCILLERYEACKSFSRIVNKALGQLLFAYVLSSIMYLSTCMDAVLVLQDWSGKARVAFFIFILIVMFFVGSEIVNRVYSLRTWLSVPSNNEFLSERNLLVLIHEVTCKPIGVSGNGMFTITYSTFMTVMTTTVTFFIIILQFQKNDREDIVTTMTNLTASHTLRKTLRCYND